VALVLDSGVVYSSLDRNDADHAACSSLLNDASESLVIPEPVLVEVDYLVGTRLKPAVFSALLDDILAGAYVLEHLEASDLERVRHLCRQYEDAEIGFVDASVVAITERLGEDKVATLDRRHFGIIRPRHVDAFRLVPDRF
jgi:predicted nucleic acid-binding protein